MAAPSAVVKGGRILVVDDEPMVRDTLGQVLADEGYVVDVAVDGADALDRVHAARPDVILLDLMMPGMNGRQFLSALREDKAYSEVPVLIMTAVHGLEINLSAIGASEVVEKPFQIDDLLNKIALAVYRSRDADGSTPLPILIEPTEPVEVDRGVVLVVEHDRARLQRVDMLLSARGYTVVSMTRAGGQLPRLARALRPRAILLEAASDGAFEVARELRDISAGPLGNPLEVFVYSRDHHAPSNWPGVLVSVTDADLVAFVDAQP
jgi:DNA-binding response OmpR family regulator